MICAVKSRNKLYPVVSLIVLLATLSSQYSQATQTEQEQTKTHKGVVKIKKKGWELRGLADGGQASRSEVGKVNGEGSASIYVSSMRPKAPGVLLEDTPLPIMAEVIYRYDVDGKAFCYLYYGTCVGFFRQQNGGKVMDYKGCKTGFAFYENDGDGKFERLEIALPFGFKPKVPEYLLRGLGNS